MLAVNEKTQKVSNEDLCPYTNAVQLKVHILGQISVDKNHLLPLFISKVSAGFPSPADDYLEQRISLDSIILTNPTASFIVQAQGNSMIGAGILDKSYLVVDRSLEPRHDDIVIVSINSEHTVKRLKKMPNGKVLLCPENPDFPVIELKEELENILWGVVICIMNPLRKR